MRMLCQLISTVARGDLDNLSRQTSDPECLPQADNVQNGLVAKVDRRRDEFLRLDY
jgi:hypothetical protein